MYWLTRLVALEELKELFGLRNGDNEEAFSVFSLPNCRASQTGMD